MPFEIKLEIVIFIMNIFSELVAKELNLNVKHVDNTISLLEQGATIPFISRYRKERTGSMTDEEITNVSELNEKFKSVAKRKETIVNAIENAGSLTDELKTRIDDCWDLAILEDIYLPYKPKRRTKAQVAKEKGLEPLADVIMAGHEQNPLKYAERFISDSVASAEEAIDGAKDIIAERISEDEKARFQLRNTFLRSAKITSKVIKSKKHLPEAQKFSNYFDYSEPLKTCSSHRLLAVRRGEMEGFLRVSIDVDYEEDCIGRLQRLYVRGTSPSGRIVNEAAEDAFKRLIKPSIENEFASLSKQRADDEAIRVFADNLRQLLLAAPLGEKRVMGIDPGFRTGCKVVCVDEQGNLLHNETIYPHPPVSHRMQAKVHLEQLVTDYAIEAIAVGNGTAGRETMNFIKDLDIAESIKVFSVSEDGASIYSASKLAREEFPDKDVTVRGAVSIARRLMDPLAELVKIEPKSIGVGQYQHDVDQNKLKQSLDRTVEYCVNAVGVNLNTASAQLLTYVSGLGPTLAQNIVDYRTQNGLFTSRSGLKKVPRLGPATYEQCAGFLRIPNAKNPLDNTAVHPESYKIVEQMAKDLRTTVAKLVVDKDLQSKIDINSYVTEDVGLPTLTDIKNELEKPGRDPRCEIEEFEFDNRVNTIEDLQTGMVLPGIVTNVTNFGAFVDIGVHQDGLVHISQLSDRFVKDPHEVVSLRQHVIVKVVDVDMDRNRISLSLKNINQ